MKLPRLWLQHTVTIEPHLGENGYGQDVWGPGVAIQGWLEQKVKNVRSPDGSETVSSSQFHCDLDTVAPARSRATLPDGTQTLAITASRMDGGTLPLPSHLVISLE